MIEYDGDCTLTYHLGDACYYSVRIIPSFAAVLFRAFMILFLHDSSRLSDPAIDWGADFAWTVRIGG